MIREERDHGFWQRIADHPAVAPHVTMGRGGFDLAGVIAHPSVLPLASEHGGYLFYRLDGMGRAYELHALYTPEGWGRETNAALKAATERLRNQGVALLIVHEVEGNWRSRPPKSHGWKAASDFTASPAGPLKTHVLTMADWLQSPARRRMT